MSQENNAGQEKAAVEPNKSKALVIVLIIIIVLLTVVCGILGYFLKKEVDDHGSTVRQLTAQTNIVNENAQVIRDAKLEPLFRKVSQDNANRNCSSASAIIFNTTTSLEKNADGTIKKYFAVGQFICNNGNIADAGPIRFVVAQSRDGITWEGNYISSTNTPTSLPRYIFNSDAALYNRKYNNPSAF
jgi:hypothetical protein